MIYNFMFVMLLLDLSMSEGIYGWVMLTGMITLSYIIAFIAWLLVSRMKNKVIRVFIKSVIVVTVFPLLHFNSRAYLLPLWMLWLK